MIGPTEAILNHLSSLSERDADLCKSYISKRDFESVKEIVDSAIVMYKRRITKMPEEDSNFHLSEMLDLKNLVDSYVSLLKTLGVIDDALYDPEESLDDEIYRDSDDSEIF